MNEIINVHLLGSFLLQNSKVTLTEDSFHSNKITRLLIYLILHRERIVTQTELLDNLFKKKSKNPAGGLKNLVYRARTILAENGLPDMVLTVTGGYQWNLDYEVHLDCTDYEALVKAAQQETDLHRQQQLCEEVVRTFQGNITMRAINEEWLVAIAEEYRTMYLDTVRILGTIYEKRCMWKELEQLCEQAFEQDSMDEELHYWMIYSLNGQKKYDEAMQHYEETCRNLFRTLGIRNTEKLRSAFNDMFKQQPDGGTNIVGLLDELDEARTQEGAFICDYQVFRQIYRVEARRLRRSGMAEWLVLLTVKYRNPDMAESDPAKDPWIMNCMDNLEDLLRDNLRAGDVGARYNTLQFILLLPACPQEAAEMVIRRLQKKFASNIGRTILELDYEIEEICVV